MANITLKGTINTFLQETGYRYFYATTIEEAVFPYIRYTLGDNYSARLSNKKAIKNIWYQLDVFSDRPLDVEESEMLTVIENGLEERGLYTTNWIEVIDDDSSIGYPIYRYFIEVRK